VHFLNVINEKWDLYFTRPKEYTNLFGIYHHPHLLFEFVVKKDESDQKNNISYICNKQNVGGHSIKQSKQICTCGGMY
jgi:hypothetical protein